MVDSERKITYKQMASISTEQLLSLYHSVQWSAYTDHPDKMAKILEGSASYLSAWHDDLLVGLVRAVSDGASIVYIQDILVRPTYQRNGIGRHLLQSLLEQYTDIRQIVLLTDDTEKTKAFYQSLGFSVAGDMGAVAFIRMNTDA